MTEEKTHMKIDTDIRQGESERQNKSNRQGEEIRCNLCKDLQKVSAQGFLWAFFFSCQMCKPGVAFGTLNGMSSYDSVDA